MKLHSTTIICTTICLAAPHTLAANHYLNTISAHNISSLQHAITKTAFSSFAPQAPTTPTPSSAHAAKYGYEPLYGTMSIYGEYNDDGRSGGDTTPSPRQTINNAWLNWQHVGNDTKFDEITHLDSKHNLYMGGITSGRTKFASGHTAWGIYTGYLDGTTTSHSLNIDTNGGFFGIYNRYQSQKLSISATINGGTTNNTGTTQYGIDEITNFWIGGTANTTYNIALDHTFTLQPNIQIGYTWIKSENYTSTSNDIIKNNAFNMFEITPGISAIKHIANNWFGKISVKHIMIFDNGGNTTINNIALPPLTNHSFTEYEISLEKAVGPIVLRTNIGRRDGGHSGWIGGLNFKYLF